jgi:hypothetical protein
MSTVISLSLGKILGSFMLFSSINFISSLKVHSKNVHVDIKDSSSSLSESSDSKYSFMSNSTFSGSCSDDIVAQSEFASE